MKRYIRSVSESVANESELTLYHGSNNPNLTIDSITISSNGNEFGFHLGSGAVSRNVMKIRGYKYLYEVKISTDGLVGPVNDREKWYGFELMYELNQHNIISAYELEKFKRIAAGDAQYQMQVTAATLNRLKIYTIQYHNSVENVGNDDTSYMVVNREVIKSINKVNQ